MRTDLETIQEFSAESALVSAAFAVHNSGEAVEPLENIMCLPDTNSGDSTALGRIVGEYLDGAGEPRECEARLLAGHPHLAQILREQFAVIRRLRLLTGARRVSRPRTH